MMKPLSWIKKTIIYIFLPILVLVEGISTFIKPKDRNPLKRDVPLSGQRIGAFNMDFKYTLPEMKKVAKLNKISLNDLFISILSNTIHEYFQKYGHEGPLNSKVDQLWFGLPFSIRERVDSID